MHVTIKDNETISVWL